MLMETLEVAKQSSHLPKALVDLLCPVISACTFPLGLELVDGFPCLPKERSWARWFGWGRAGWCWNGGRHWLRSFRLGPHGLGWSHYLRWRGLWWRGFLWGCDGLFNDSPLPRCGISHTLGSASTSFLHGFRRDFRQLLRIFNYLFRIVRQFL